MKYDDRSGNVSLLINQIGPGDEGEYTCTARNQYGEAICSVFIQPEGMWFKMCIMLKCACSEMSRDPMIFCFRQVCIEHKFLFLKKMLLGAFKI